MATQTDWDQVIQKLSAAAQRLQAAGGQLAQSQFGQKVTTGAQRLAVRAQRWSASKLATPIGPPKQKAHRLVGWLSRQVARGISKWPVVKGWGQKALSAAKVGRHRFGQWAQTPQGQKAVASAKTFAGSAYQWVASKLTGQPKPPPKQKTHWLTSWFKNQASSTRVGRWALKARRAGRWMKAGSRAAKAAGYTRLGATLARLGAAAGPAGLAVAAVAAVTVAAVAFGKAIHGMTQEALRAQMRLAEVSGAMASVMAERQIREVLRDQRQGAKLASTARDLARAEQDMKDSLEPMETLITNIKNTVLANIERTLGDILAPVALIAEYVNAKVFGAPSADPISESLKAIADEAEKARARGDATFSRPSTARHRP
jgi:hypothetical protein